MGLFDFLKEKTKYVIDKSYIENKYIKDAFRFLIDSGYQYEYYQKNSEREFVYILKDCRVEIFLDGYVFDCIIKTKDFSRANITQNPLVDQGFKDRFFASSNLERIDMVVDVLRKNPELFCLNKFFK